MKAIHTKKAPGAIGPYSQAVVANGFVFCSGQIGLDPKTGEMVEGIEKQTRRVMDNLVGVLSAAGTDLAFVVKTTIYLKNISDFPVVNGIYGEYFTIHKPSRATVGVGDLPKGALIEIDAIAVVKK
ncbi:RidA family protein [Patescibacteria group bacterium]|nr:RidA family protein [Patescibacteria group bacterium]MBU4015893.1 RidA family protein [Patescibacteria group bacterium]